MMIMENAFMTCVYMQITNFRLWPRNSWADGYDKAKSPANYQDFPVEKQNKELDSSINHHS